MWRICIDLSRRVDQVFVEGRVCIEIPLLYDPFWKLRRPHPEPWLTLKGEAVDIAQDLQILASIAGLARDLSPEFGRTVNAGLEQAASSMKGKLPEGVELHFQEQTAE